MGIDLDKLTTDLLLIVRGSQISQSEPISKRQVEDWIHQYRALLLKQSIDKGAMLSTEYIQELDDLSIDLIEGSEDNEINSDCYILRTDNKIPKSLNFGKRSGITYVGTILGKQLQIVPYNRLHMQKYKKYTSNSELAALRNQYVYVLNNEQLRYINVRGIFENPLEVGEIDGEDYRKNYPLPQDKIPIVKQMILKQELGMESQSPSDTENDSSHRVSPNVEKHVANVQRQE